MIVPALPGCISDGGTVPEAMRNAREAIELHLDNLAAHREPKPNRSRRRTIIREAGLPVREFVKLLSR